MSEQRVCARAFLFSVLSGIALGQIPAEAQMTTGYRPIEEPGIYGVRIHPSALAPTRRKWYLPQNLYYEYRWRGWEYTNYAREQYDRYVDVLLEGTRHYDSFGNYISRGWMIYDWTEVSPQRLGSGIFKSPKYSSWFSSVVVSSASKGQNYTSLMIGDAIRTTLTPLTFSKPTYNGIQWDYVSDKYAVTLLASRLNSPGVTAVSDGQSPALVENSSRLMATRGVAQVGDFAKMGLTWVNVANASSELSLAKNSLKGILTGPQNTGNVESVIIRISDDSPESPDSGALLFFDRILIDGEVHPEIIPLVRGGVRRAGILQANGPDVIELIYDIRNSFRPTETMENFREAKRLEFELVVANDYKIEVTSNLQTDIRGDEVFLLVEQARNDITDGSNQKFIRFEYGLPTANELIGVDLELFSLGGFDLRAEWVVNRRFRRFPNQNFRKLAAVEERSDAAYVTASYVRYPWFAYGEAFRLDPDYSTTAFISDARGFVDYGDPRRHFFDFVDDNDDQDRFPDNQRFGQVGQTASVVAGAAGGDLRVFPGLDENNDFISDFNQNQNATPDYEEPFLRYNVDRPEFLFGMDMNNNTIIDRFENDNEPDYPYERDHSGYNVYGGAAFTETIQLTIGRLSERQLSSARKSRATYALFTATWNYPGLRISLFEHAKMVKDDIAEDRIIWVDPTGQQNFPDPLVNQDTMVNTAYLEARYAPRRNLNILGKLKYEKFFQRGDQADLQRNRAFLGVINKADYALQLGQNITIWPKWKSTFRREKPSSLDNARKRDLQEALFLVTRYALLPGEMWLDFGLEFNWFENLKKRPDEPPPDFAEDFNSRVFSVLFSNISAYLGYELTLNAGFLFERQKFTQETQSETLSFLRVVASTGTE